VSAGWLDRQVLVTVGTGGVGKTTVAAALGLAAARHGKRVLVLTIDPARRLADALGLPGLDHEVREIPRKVLESAGVAGGGALFAMMLDTKRTFHELLDRYAPDPETRERILENPIYRNLTDALAGSREYSAMEKLYQLHGEGTYDLIVLDTPPASHALDFLEAPRRLTGFLDSPVLRLLFRPALAMGRTGFRLFRLGSNVFLPLVERITGIEFLRMVSEFLLAFESLWEGVGARAREIDKLLRDPVTGFLLVVGADPVQRRRAVEFWERLDQEQIHLAGLVVNRIHEWPGGEPPPALDDAARANAIDQLAARLEPAAARANATALVDMILRQAALARRDRGLGTTLGRELPLDARDVRVIPLFDEDIHALEALGRMAERLVPETDRA
jgi:anion-transporting  ArsA/GET3 family ATPase